MSAEMLDVLTQALVILYMITFEIEQKLCAAEKIAVFDKRAVIIGVRHHKKVSRPAIEALERRPRLLAVKQNRQSVLFHNLRILKG